MPYGVESPELLFLERLIGSEWTGDRYVLDTAIWEITLRMWWDEEQETRPRILYGGKIKRYPLGFRFRAEVAWRELRSHVLTRIIRDAHNWLLNVPPNTERQLRFRPHGDVPDLEYVVNIDNAWDYDYSFRQRWIGFGGAVRFRGVERIDKIPWFTVNVIQSSTDLGCNWGAQYFADSAGLVGDGYDGYYDAYQIGVFFPDTNAAALFRMEMGLGSVLYDATVNRNDATISGALWLKSVKDWQNNALVGYDGNGLRFDGTDDYVTIPHHSSLLIFGSGEDGTVELAMRRDGIPAATETMLSKGSTAGFALKVNVTTGFPEFQISDGTFTDTVTGTTNVCDNEWHHIRAERDDDGNVAIYVDGPVAEDTTASTTGVASNALDAYIGRLTGGTEYFEGDLDELRLSSVLRSSFTH